MTRIDPLWAYEMHYVPARGQQAQATSHGPTDIAAEFRLDAPTTLADLATIERSCPWCFEAHRVQLVRLFLAHDRKRAVLVFRAPDAESVRLACRQADIAFERVWSCHRIIKRRAE